MEMMGFGPILFVLIMLMAGGIQGWQRYSGCSH